MMNNVQHLAGKVSSAPSQGGIVRCYRPVRYEMGGFDESVHPEVQAMHREAQWFINDVVNKVRPRRWLSLLGASGVGKTHLAESVKAVLVQERPHLLTQCWKWQKAVSMLRGGEWTFVEYLVREVDVLILDDVGAENITPAILSALTRRFPMPGIPSRGFRVPAICGPPWTTRGSYFLRASSMSAAPSRPFARA